jgi:hypothetical protein
MVMGVWVFGGGLNGEEREVGQKRVGLRSEALGSWLSDGGEWVFYC